MTFVPRGVITTKYTEYLFWSVVLGEEAARISIADEERNEYFAIVAVGSTKQYRAKREEVLGQLCSAIDLGIAPGEIRIAP